jgi:hypothetical protein
VQLISTYCDDSHFFHFLVYSNPGASARLNQILPHLVHQQSLVCNIKISINNVKLSQVEWGSTNSAFVCCDFLLEFGSKSNNFVLLLLCPGVFIQSLGTNRK